ncbi:MAG: hypothetical protein JNM84_25670 [Planctomycetes bacterium]|nr:hypothetical protein [Planctomycetota bacterium]
MRELLEQKVIQRAVAVYLGERRQIDDGVLVLPAREWARALGEILC